LFDCIVWNASIHISHIALVKLNKMNESAAEEKEEQKEKSVPSSQPPPTPLLKALEYIVHNRIVQKKKAKMHKTRTEWIQ
jgi:hypothetical protein